MCLWNGLMKIVKETSLITKLSNFLYPLIHFLFPNLRKEDREYKEISINIIANLLGIGNAATPSGLQAMKTMQEKNINKNIWRKDYEYNKLYFNDGCANDYCCNNYIWNN